VPSELQRLVDALGESLGRSAAIDDRRLRLQAYSPHYGPVDETRLASVLHRQADERSTAWVLSQGIATAASPVRLPGNDDLSMLPRVCAPIRHQDLLLGYLWLIDAGAALTDEELGLVAEAANAAAVVMYRERLVQELENGRQRELMRDLLFGEPGITLDAANTLREESLFAADLSAAVFVLRPAGLPEPVSSDVREAVELALIATRRRLPLRHSLHLDRLDHGVLLVGVTGKLLTLEGLSGLAEDLRTDFTRAMPQFAGRTLIGVSDVMSRLDSAPTHYQQALSAARVVEIITGVGDLAHWSNLGVYRTLARLPAEELCARALPPGLLTLIEADSNGTLTATLERFLDFAGDVKATSEDLALHRASLYYRLRRIEQVTGADLRDGNDRLALHLGIKIARLAGLWAGSSQSVLTPAKRARAATRPPSPHA